MAGVEKAQLPPIPSGPVTGEALRSILSIVLRDILKYADIRNATGTSPVSVSGGAGEYATLGLTDGERGDITVADSGSTWNIDDGAVTYAKIQDVREPDRILGLTAAAVAGQTITVTCDVAVAVGTRDFTVGVDDVPGYAGGFGGVFSVLTGATLEQYAYGDGSVDSAAAVSMGGGIWRCSVTGIASAAGTKVSPFVGLAIGYSSNTWAGDNTSGVYVSRAEIVMGDTAGVGTNIIAAPSAFDSGWTRTNIRAFGSGSTENAGTAADGTLTADLITEDTGTGGHYLSLASELTIGSGQIEEIPCTAAGRALLDDATAAAQLTTLGLQSAVTRIYGGTGTPEAVVSAVVGSLFLRTDGGASTVLYVKESGAGGNTGWVAK